MKNSLKTIALLVLTTLFFEPSSGQCKENMNSKESEVAESAIHSLYSKEAKSNLIFDFMRHSQLLKEVDEWRKSVDLEKKVKHTLFELIFKSPFLAATIDKINNDEIQVNKNNKDEQLSNETLRFRKLFFQLEEQLLILINAEKNLAASKEDPKLAQMKAKFDSMSSFPFPKTKEQLDQMLEELSELKEIEYQNIVDSQSLFIAMGFDFAHLNNTLMAIEENQRQESLSKIHENLLKKYKKFIVQNEAALQRIEQIADNGYIIKVSYEGDKLGVEKIKERSVKTLSELMQDSQISSMPLAEKIFQRFVQELQKIQNEKGKSDL